MKTRILLGLTLLSSLFGHLEWGQGAGAFLYQVEWEVLSKLFTRPADVAHPFTLIPLFGQGLLLAAVLHRPPSRRLAYAGIGGIAFLLLFVLVIGILSRNVRIAASTLPFLVLSVATVRALRGSAAAASVPAGRV